jgi:polar amino acid transport system substrate-binding protein
VKSANKASFTTLASLCGYKVSVEAGTTEESDAQGQAPKCPKSKPLTVDSYQDQNSANAAILSGQDAVGFADSQVAGYIVAQSNKQFKLSGAPFSVAPYGIATAKTTAGLGFAKAIQAAIKVLIGNGVYKDIMTKWGVTAGSLTAAKISLNGAVS